jgi:glutamyl/glutaminyl-tRNA synthetase
MIVCLLMKRLIAIKKNFGIQNSNSLKLEGFVEPSLASSLAGDKFQFQRLGYFNTQMIACQEN